jgi:hypothetical protein
MRQVSPSTLDTGLAGEDQRMQWVLLFMIPAVVFMIFGLISPRVGPPPRWRVRLGTLAGRLAAPLRTRIARRRPPPVADPFEVLRLQMRLGVLADQVRALEGDAQIYAKAHRLRATRAAYDDLLGEACLLAGVKPVPETRRSEEERLREEVELASRGWSW